MEWYLEQCEAQIGDSLEELDRMKKLTNLVLRRLVKVDHVLVVIGEGGIVRPLAQPRPKMPPKWRGHAEVQIVAKIIRRSF